MKLVPKRRLQTQLALLCLALLVLLGKACPNDGQHKLKINHKLHVVQEEIECASCHDLEEVGPSMRPNHALCESCHEFDMDAPDKACLLCHDIPASLKKQAKPEQLKKLAPLLTEYYEQRKARVAAERGDVIFDHEKHKETACTVCHGDMLADRTKQMREMALCQDCHRRQQVKEDADDACAVCHRVLREDVKPKNHSTSWLNAGHGPESFITRDKCSYCHERNFCEECHSSEKPQNHTALFRKRGHGFFAEHNRRSCLACHQVDFCEQCHLEVEPRTHTSSFKRGGHCKECHFPINKGTKCQVCHLEPGHPAGPVIDHPLDTRLDCTLCHRRSLASHRTTTVRPNECVVCHPSGSAIPLTPGSGRPPHPLRGVPFSDCQICH